VMSIWQVATPAYHLHVPIHNILIHLLTRTICCGQEHAGDMQVLQLAIY